MLNIRPIRSEDNPIIEQIIKTSLEEHKANLPGTAYFDKNLSKLSEFYSHIDDIEYFVAEYDGKVVGGSGIGKIEGNNTNVCELQKIYLSKETRGKGIGKALMQACLEFAKEKKYDACYLETMPQLVGGVNLYQKMGFKTLDKPLGNTNHHACQIWMLKTL
ncbi:GNAT family N-acetyltransferase [Flammeovirga sp. MY04]|uniref:GNAT family N-acetyltransferase n=1 Tax=Flammeovirga sp. MY04 TaxID=1191459 RepID=UPI0008062E3D|nr:GNAT family N-acetyltransferase [Flammeovirga sp. MY04]ANQ47665.1 GNAT family N-acetyltransferase [Flammeovirga sp. MY04]